ncbi:hypothetical protein F1645_09770 [Novacetimonas hansenii]
MVKLFLKSFERRCIFEKRQHPGTFPVFYQQLVSKQSLKGKRKGRRLAVSQWLFFDGRFSSCRCSDRRCSAWLLFYRAHFGPGRELCPVPQVWDSKMVKDNAHVPCIMPTGPAFAPRTGPWHPARGPARSPPGGS